MSADLCRDYFIRRFFVEVKETEGQCRYDQLSLICMRVNQLLKSASMLNIVIRALASPWCHVWIVLLHIMNKTLTWKLTCNYIRRVKFVRSGQVLPSHIPQSYGRELLIKEVLSSITIGGSQEARTEYVISQTDGSRPSCLSGICWIITYPNGAYAVNEDSAYWKTKKRNNVALYAPLTICMAFIFPWLTIGISHQWSVSGDSWLFLIVYGQSWCYRVTDLVQLNREKWLWDPW